MLRKETANALDTELVRQLLVSLKGAADQRIRMLTLAGEGKHFSAGVDLNIDSENQEAIAYRFIEIELLLQYLRNAPFVSVAYVCGAAFGAGADLALACDYRIGVKDSRFCFPGARLGISLGNHHLARVIGPEHARDLLLTGRIIHAEESLRLGLLSRLEEDKQNFISTVGRLAERFATLTIDDIRRIISITRPGWHDNDLSSLVDSVADSDLKARIAAYKEKVSFTLKGSDSYAQP